MISTGRRRILCVTLIACALVPSLAGNADPTIDGLDRIVVSKETVKSYVLDIKTKYKPTDQQYLSARKLYLTALAEYAGWTTQLRFAVVAGKAKDLRKDENYKKIGTNAQAASKAFVDFVEQSTTATPKSASVVTSLIDIGVRIWNAVKDRQAKERQMLADFIAKEAKWETWDEIKVPAATSSK